MPDQSAIDKLREYFSQGAEHFTPGMIGAGAGALAGGFATGPRANENPRQRALRTIRNAMGAGLLGGVGTQALAESGKQIGSVVAPGPAADKPGIMRSALGRLSMPLAAHGLASIGRHGRQAQTLQAMFQGVGKVDVPGVTKAPLASPTGGTTFDFSRPVEHAGVKSHYKTLADSLRLSAKDPATWNNTLDTLTSKTKVNPTEARAWLERNFGQKLHQRGLRALTPGSTAFATRNMRLGGGIAGTAAQLGLAFAAPDAAAHAWDAGTNAAGDAAAGYVANPVAGTEETKKGITDGFKLF